MSRDVDGRTDGHDNAVVAPCNFARIAAFQLHCGRANEPDMFKFYIILQIL